MTQQMPGAPDAALDQLIASQLGAVPGGPSINQLLDQQIADRAANYGQPAQPELPLPIGGAEALGQARQLEAQRTQGIADREAAYQEEKIQEARHGYLETIGTQAARGLLDLIISPGALAGAAVESAGELFGADRVRDFGRDMGEVSNAKMLGQLGAFYLGGQGDRGVSRAAKTQRFVEEQEKAWPTLSTVSRIAGAIAGGAPALAGGGFALAAGTGAAGGAQSSYAEQEPLRDVLTSTLVGAAFGLGAEGAARGIGAAGRKVLGRGASRGAGAVDEVPGTPLLSEGEFGVPRYQGVTPQTERLLPAPRVTVEEAGGREAQSVIHDLDRLAQRAKSAGEAAGDNAELRRMAEETAQREVTEELAKAARGFDPDNWQSKAPTPIQRVVYRTEILDKAADDITEAAQGVQAVEHEIPQRLDPSKIEALVDPANTPQALGLIQSRVESVLNGLPETDNTQGVRNVLLKSLNQFERKGRSAKVVKLIDAVEDHLGPNLDAHDYLGKWSQDGWNELARRAGIRAPSQNTIDQVLTHYEYSPMTGRAKFAVSNLPDTMAQGHFLATELERVAQFAGESGDEPLRQFAETQRRALIDDLSSPLFGKAGQAYRAMWKRPGDEFVQLADRDTVREALRASAADVEVIPAIEAEVMRQQEAKSAIQLLTGVNIPGEAQAASSAGRWDPNWFHGEAPPSAKPFTGRPPVQELRDVAYKAHQATTLDGGPIGRVFDWFEQSLENRGAKKIGGIVGGLIGNAVGGPLGAAAGFASGHYVGEAVKPYLKAVIPMLRPLAIQGGKAGLAAARAGVGSSLGAVGAATKRAAPLVPFFALGREEKQDQYQERVDMLQNAASGQDPSVFERTLRGSGVPHEMLGDITAAFSEKVNNLAVEMPKPVPDIRGPSYETLSQDQLQLANAMYEATVEPLSIFRDLGAGMLDYDKVKYAWRQWPGLQSAVRAGIADIIQVQLTPEERAQIPEKSLAQLDLMLGMKGALSSTVDPTFSARMDQIGEQSRQQQQQQRPSQGSLSTSLAAPTFTERVAGVRNRY